ncbi:MAG: threonine aldolase [Spirochaetales bacterium]|nr:MAG: threonine aldolase [Spirochaetales bacterium]
MEKIIDLRSDTVTKPTERMRKAMYEAEVGDDVLGEDPTINKLQRLGAEMTGKEASLFVPSGTFGNQCAIMTHCARGSEVICAEDSHIVEHEAGAPGVLSGVNLRPVAPAGLHLTWEEILKRVRTGKDIHQPATGLIAIENALGTGAVMPEAEMERIYRGAREQGIPVHCDGARIFNAAWALGVKASRLGRYTDSLMFCLSKGLCAPVGSLLAGTENFVEKARYSRKLMGGGMRQAGILAAAGLIALTEMTERLPEDHALALRLSEGLSAFKELSVARDRVKINMVFIRVVAGSVNGLQFVRNLAELGILTYPPFGEPPGDGEIRFVIHAGISAGDIDYVLSGTGRALAGTGK